MGSETDPMEAVPTRHTGTENLLSLAQLDAQHSVGHGPDRSECLLGLDRSALMPQRQALCGFHARGLHAPGLLLHLTHTPDRPLS